MKTTKLHGKVAVTLTEFEKYFKTLDCQDCLSGVYEWIDKVSQRHIPKVNAWLDKESIAKNVRFHYGECADTVIIAVSLALDIRGVEIIMLNK